MGSHKNLSEKDISIDGDRQICVCCDKWSSWISGYPDPSKAGDPTQDAMQKFFGPELNTKYHHIYSDNSGEIEKAGKKLGLSHDTSEAHRPSTNGIAENAVRKVKEGASCTLSQSGFCDIWWNYAVLCFCFLRNVRDVMANGMTPYKTRFGEDFRRELIPMGAEMRYYPISQADKERLPQIGEKTLPALFLGYEQQAGGGWNGRYFFVDWWEVHHAENTSEIHVKSQSSEDLFPVMYNGEFRLPLIEGDLEQPGLSANQARKHKIRKKRVREAQHTRVMQQRLFECNKLNAPTKV